MSFITTYIIILKQMKQLLSNYNKYHKQNFFNISNKNTHLALKRLYKFQHFLSNNNNKTNIILTNFVAFLTNY